MKITIEVDGTDEAREMTQALQRQSVMLCREFPGTATMLDGVGQQIARQVPSKDDGDDDIPEFGGYDAFGGSAERMGRESTPKGEPDDDIPF